MWTCGGSERNNAIVKLIAGILEQFKQYNPAHSENSVTVNVLRLQSSRLLKFLPVKLLRLYSTADCRIFGAVKNYDVNLGAATVLRPINGGNFGAV